MAEIKISDEGLAQQIAKAIRDAVADADDCIADEEACFERHPVHLGWSVEGEIRAVYARVDGLAKILAAALVASGWRREAQPAEIIDRIIKEINRRRASAERRADQMRDEPAIHDANLNFADGLAIALGVISREVGRAASEAGQYVSAGTRTDEDQRRDDEGVCSKCGSASCVADKRASAEWDGHV